MVDTGFCAGFVHLLPLFNGWFLKFLDDRRLFHVVGIFSNHLTITSHEIRSAFILVSIIESFVFVSDMPFEAFLLTLYFETEPALHFLLTRRVFLV